MTKYYTIHPRRLWKKFLKQGYIVGDMEYAMYPKQYKWMMEQMINRLPNYQGECPIWLWTEHPPFYRYGYAMTSRKKYVLLTVELNDGDVLLSDFDAWHIPLNNGTFNDDGVQSYSDFKSQRNSNYSDWEKIFDFEWLKKHFHENESVLMNLQGTTGKIAIENVVAVKHFTTKKHLI